VGPGQQRPGPALLVSALLRRSHGGSGRLRHADRGDPWVQAESNIPDDEAIFRIVAVAVAAFFGSLATVPMASAAAIIKGTYYEDNAAIECPTSSACVVAFSPIPADKAVLVTHIACRAEANQASLQFIFLAAQGGNPLRREYLEVVPIETVGILGGATFHAYAANEPTSFFFSAKAIPLVVVQFSTQSTGTLACRIVGQIPAPV
jgi:hypothetical protein